MEPAFTSLVAQCVNVHCHDPKPIQLLLTVGRTIAERKESARAACERESGKEGRRTQPRKGHALHGIDKAPSQQTIAKHRVRKRSTKLTNFTYTSFLLKPSHGKHH